MCFLYVFFCITFFVYLIYSSGQLSLDISSTEVTNKKIKEEIPAVPVKRGPGRPKGRRNSSLSTTQVLSPLENGGEEELLSPNTRRSTRQMLRGNRKRDSPSTSPKPESPSGPGRPKKSRKSTRGGEKTPNTTKTEFFSFGNSNGKSLPSVSSPTTSFFPPTAKPASTSLTSQKDIEVSEADLMHLFDDEDEEDNCHAKVCFNAGKLFCILGTNLLIFLLYFLNDLSMLSLNVFSCR